MNGCGLPFDDCSASRAGRSESMTVNRPRLPILLLLAAVIGCGVAADAAASDAEDHFEKRVRPLFVERCHKCHAGATSKGGFRLDSREALLKGGESGPAVVLGRPDESLLLQAVRHQDGLAMPPDGKLN